MNLTRRYLFVLAAISLLVFSVGCSDRDPAGLPVSEGDTEPMVFDDDFHPDVYFQPFFRTHYTAMSRDSVYAHPVGSFAPDGARSLKFTVPPKDSALGPYTGGVLTSGGSRNLTGYNALTFYARSSLPITLNTAGMGNDNTGNSLYGADRSNVALTPDWTFVIVPIPDSSKLLSERGLFTLAEGVEDAHPEGYDVWFDDIRYASLDNIVVFRSSLTPASKSYFVGSTVAVDGTRTIFQIDGGFVPVGHSANYFDYISSNPSVAVFEQGTVKVIGVGTTTINATLGENAVQGNLTVTAYTPPTVAAAPPTLPAGDVISMFSAAYDDVPVATWRADWAGVTTQLEEFTVAGDVTKMYTSLNYVGIDFANNKIDATQMTHLHLDVYAPAGTNFKVKLGSFPSGPTAIETQDLVVDATTTPAFNSGGWSSLDIPLADFALPATGWDWGFLGLMVLSSSDAKLVLVDNVYFHK